MFETLQIRRYNLLDEDYNGFLCVILMMVSYKESQLLFFNYHEPKLIDDHYQRSLIGQLVGGVDSIGHQIRTQFDIPFSF